MNTFGSSIQKLLVNEAEHPERKLGAVRSVRDWDEHPGVPVYSHPT